METRRYRRGMERALADRADGGEMRKNIIADQIPPRELQYLRRNLRGEPQLRLIELPEGSREKQMEILLSFPPENSLFLSADREKLRRMKERGMTALGFVEKGRETGLDPSVADMLAEGCQEMDAEFLIRAYQRKHHLPWKILETERCILREVCLEDMDALFALYEGEGMTDYIEPLYEYEKEREYQEAYIAHMYGFYGFGLWAVIEKETGKLIGRAGIECREELGGELELGYVIGRPYQRRGYASEVCRAILDYARERLECGRLNCLIEQGNTVSEHLAEKLGFTFREELAVQGKRMKRYVCGL